MKNWYQLTESETLDKLGVTSEGLSSQQADSLLEKHGKNVLEESKKKSVFQVFFTPQFLKKSLEKCHYFSQERAYHIYGHTDK